MRVLAISPTPSHPTTAGNRARIAALLHEMKAAGHEIHFAYVAREGIDPEGARQMREAWGNLHLVPYDRRAEPKGEARDIDAWYQPGIDDHLRLLTTLGFDLVVVNYVFLSRALELFPATTIKVLDTHDLFADRHARLAELGLPPQFFSTTAEQETRGLDRADLVLAIQPLEAAELRRRTRADVVTMGHPLATQPLATAPPRLPTLRVGYLGSGNPLNVLAVQRFLDALAAREAEAADDRAPAPLEIVVAGDVCRDLVLPPGLRVSLLHRIAAPELLHEQVDLLVSLAVGGTGLKIKTVEALSTGLPVACTEDAALGLPAEDPDHRLADPEAVADAVRALAADPDRLERLRDASRRLFADYQEEVRRELTLLTDQERLERLVRRPVVTIATAVPFWRGGLGNRARTLNLVRALAEETRVQVLYLGSLDPSDAPLLAEQGLARRLWSFRDFAPPDAARKEQAIEKQLAGLDRSSFARVFTAALGAFQQAHPADVLVLDYVQNAYLRYAQPRPPVAILCTHDLMSARTTNFQRFGRRHFLEVDAADEFRILAEFDGLLSIQREDHETLARLYGPHRAIYAPHWAPLPPARPPERAAEPVREVVFVGGASPMNADGLAWFLQQVWPCFAPYGLRLRVCGAVCERFAGQSFAGVTFEGPVDRLEPIYARADLAINPVFFGGGLKIKTVECLHHGLPAVVTPEAVRGVPRTDPPAFLVAQSRLEFVEALRRLVVDPELRRSVSRAARRLAEAEYGPARGTAIARIVAAAAGPRGEAA